MTQANDAAASGAINGDQRQHPGPGYWLKQARERRSWTQREAADMLNLSPRFIVAMEDETFDKLPAAAFARGYLRAYSKLLGLVGDEIIRRYEAVVGDDSDPYFRALIATRRQPLGDFVRAHPGPVVGTIVALLLMVLIGGGWLLWHAGGVERALRLPEVITPAVPENATRAASGAPAAAAVTGTAPPVAADAGTAPSAVALPPPASADVVRAGDDEAGDGAALSAAAVRTPPASVTNVRGDASMDAAAARNDPAAAGTSNAPGAASTTGSDQLRVALADDCWVEVRDAHGTRLYSGMARRGANLSIAGSAPMTVVLGNAPAAQLSFNGKSVDVASHTRERIATLVVAR